MTTPSAPADSRGRSSASRAPSRRTSRAAAPTSSRPAESTRTTASARPSPMTARATVSAGRGDHCTSPGCQDAGRPTIGHMRDAVICAAVRTPVGKRGGALSGVHAVDLSAHVLGALAERTGIDPAVVDDVFWGCVSQVGEQAGVVVAGGVESMSRVPMGSARIEGAAGKPYGPRFRERYDLTPNQGIGAEMIAERWGLSRTQLDEFSLGSHEKAAKAQAD